MSSQWFFFFSAIALSIYPVFMLIIRARRRGYLVAAIRFLVFMLIACAGFIIHALIETKLLPEALSYLGNLLLIVSGLLFAQRGFQKQTDIDEMLMELNSSRFNPDRLLFNKFGNQYFYVKSIFIGSGFILAGVLLAFRS